MSRFDTKNKDVCRSWGGRPACPSPTASGTLAPRGVRKCPQMSARKKNLTPWPAAVTFGATIGPAAGVHWQRPEGPPMTRSPLPAMVRPALAAAAVVGLVTLLPAGAPGDPPAKAEPAEKAGG